MMREPDLELDLLRAFVAVAEAGSFTAAAQLVNRSQSAVSQKILRLEEVMAMRVFERSSRSLILTKDGERLLAAGRRMLGHYEDFIRELRAPPVTTTLRLGISENLVQAQLPQVLGQFHQACPDVLLELATGTGTDLLADHEAGRLDVVIAKRKNRGSSRIGRVIWREPLVWIAATSFRSDPRRPVPLVMMRPPCVYREIMTEALDAIRRDWVAACTATNLTGLQAAIGGGLGVTVMGKSFAQHGMKILPTSERWPELPQTEVAVIGENAQLQHIVQPLVSLLTDTLAGNVAAA